jgi:hypothetical protein
MQYRAVDGVTVTYCAFSLTHNLDLDNSSIDEVAGTVPCRNKNIPPS